MLSLQRHTCLLGRRPQACQPGRHLQPSSRWYIRSSPHHGAACASSAGQEAPAETCTPPSREGGGSGGAGALEAIPPAKLKALRRLGLEMKDRIKLGRRGVAEGLVRQIFQRWNSSEVAKLYCQGRHAADMKMLTQQLEQWTEGIVVHRAGGTVFLYRSEPWPREPPTLGPATVEWQGPAGEEAQLPDAVPADAPTVQN